MYAETMPIKDDNGGEIGITFKEDEGEGTMIVGWRIRWIYYAEGERWVVVPTGGVSGTGETR